MNKQQKIAEVILATDTSIQPVRALIEIKQKLGRYECVIDPVRGKIFEKDGPHGGRRRFIFNKDLYSMVCENHKGAYENWGGKYRHGF